MGVFSNIKNKIQEMIRRHNTPKLQEAPPNWFNQPGELGNSRIITIPTLDDDKMAGISALNQFGQNYHTQDGTQNKIMVARILDMSKGNTFVGNGGYVAFEMPANISPTDRRLMDVVVQNYEYLRNISPEHECLFVGNPYANNELEYMKYMQNYVDENIGTQIKAFKESENQKRNEENAYNAKINEARKRFDDQIRYEGIDRNNRAEDEQRTYRMNHPQIEPCDSYKGNDGKRYYDYNANNIENGYVLRIRKLNRVGKDESGRYLYTGFIENVYNDEKTPEVLDKNARPKGIEVCFSIDKKVEDIVAQNNPYEIRKLSELFSKEENFRNDNGKLNYIGCLDRNGNVTKGDDNSNAISNKIMELQNEAYQTDVINKTKANQQGRG